MRIQMWALVGMIAGMALGVSVSLAQEETRTASPRPTAAKAVPPPRIVIEKPTNAPSPVLSNSTISCDQASLNFRVVGASRTVRITNTGNGCVEWSATPSADAIRVEPAAGLLEAGQEQKVTITLKAAFGSRESVMVVVSPSRQPPRVIEVDYTGADGKTGTVLQQLRCETAGRGLR